MKAKNVDNDSMEYKKKKEECIVSDSKDIHEYPIFGEKPRFRKSIFKIKKVGIISILVLIILIVGGVVLSINISDKNFNILKKNYNRYVITTEDTTLFDSNRKKVGNINSGLKLVLTDIKALSKKDKYLKIDGTNYYVYYKDIKKVSEFKKDDKPSYYISSGKSIKAQGEVKLYKDDKVVGTLNNGIEANLEYADDKYYYIDFLNDTYKVENNKNISIVQSDEVFENISDHVSIIYYDLIDDNCSEDSCLKVGSAKSHINKILDAGYYSITKEDYISYINGYTNLEKNAVLFSVGVVNENSQAIEKELNISFAKFESTDGLGFATTNKTTTPSDDKNALNIYKVKRYYFIDDYVRMAAGEEVVDAGWQTSSNQSVPVINYHFFTNKEKDIICVPYETICLEESLFRSHLDYLKENNYKTLTIHEFSDWMDGLIEIPEKSVLITVDDGAKGTGAHNGNILIPVLEEYKMHATLFLIAGWWDISNYQSPYLDIQSHTFDMHGGASGRKILSLSHDEIYEDIKKSLDIIQDNTTFCYPFYEYDNKSIQALQELGVKYAFAGGSRNAKRSDNHYIIPRYPIVGDVTKQEFAKMVS